MAFHVHLGFSAGDPSIRSHQFVILKALGWDLVVVYFPWDSAKGPWCHGAKWRKASTLGAPTCFSNKPVTNPFIDSEDRSEGGITLS